MRQTCEIVRRARPLLGTLVEIRVKGHGVEPAIERAFGAIERVHRAMSQQESTSDIARLRAGHWQGLDAWTRRVVERAQEIGEASDGLFDYARCDYSLDGIAKGFAVDLAVDCLLDAGLVGGVVNAGGDLRVFGEASEPIYIRPTDSPASLIYAGNFRDVALATSAAALLIDPLRRGAAPALGATVFAADCMTADALTKPCRLDPAGAAELARRFGAKVVGHDRLAA
jgi:thiamine biosynthesis lipoprotein